MNNEEYISRTLKHLKESISRWDDAFDRMQSMNFVFTDLEKEVGYEQAMVIYQQACRRLENG